MSFNPAKVIRAFYLFPYITNSSLCPTRLFESYLHNTCIIHEHLFLMVWGELGATPPANLKTAK